MGDIQHNPTRSLFWSPPYLASYLAQVVVTGVQPVDINGKFFGSISTDVSSKFALDPVSQQRAVS